PAGVTEANCKVARAADRTWPALEKEGTYRVPTAGAIFGDVALPWYASQDDKPLVSSRGHVSDHIALSVADLDAWVAKLRGEGVIGVLRDMTDVKSATRSISEEKLTGSVSYVHKDHLVNGPGMGV